jgi:putative ABC transport system permease protein
MKEISIRKVNGADRNHIIGQILLESIGIAVASYFIALLIIGLLLPQLSSLLNLPVSATFDRSTLYIWYFAGILLIGMVTGLIPGIFLSRINEIKALKDETVFNSRGIQRKLLLVFQLTIVVVMLNTTFVIRKQINYFLEKDLGFRVDNVIVSELDPLLEGKYELLKSSLVKIPGVESVSFSNGTMGESYSKSPQTLGDVSKICNMYSVDSDYIPFYLLKLKYGRGFSPDLKTDANCCIVNEETCKTFGVENLVGQSLGKREVIGVVYNFNFASLHNKIEPLVMKYGPGKIVQIRISGQNQSESISSILNTYKNVSPSFDSNYSFLDSRIKKLYKSELDLKASFEVYSLITFVIALLGLFGLTLFLLKKKTKEMSIRKLHGATLADTFMHLSKEQVIIAIVSNLIGFPLSLYTMNQWLVNFQYKVDIGYLIFLKTFLITLVFTLLAVSFLIVKTHRLNLVRTLKRE